MLLHKHVVRVGRLAKRAARLRGGGSALPGLIVEKIDPAFLARTLSELPYGVVVISGTNGKTTTTKMVVELLRTTGLRVFTNPTGSNFTRGVIASLLDKLNPQGVLEADIAVLELDEAHATHFIRQISPRYSLLLNVMRDQLDRFGEIDHTSRLLTKLALATTGTVVFNRSDPLVRSIADSLPGSVDKRFFGLNPALRGLFPSDQDLYGTVGAGKSAKEDDSTDVVLFATNDREVVFVVDGHKTPPITLSLDGAYNALNAAAALCLVRAIVDNRVTTTALLQSLSRVAPAFGRGEAITVNGDPLEIVLVKNPSGFRLALESYASRPAATMIAINDNYADGRDMSWLWDVDFRSLGKVSVVSGIRAYDMALRLQYDDVEMRHVEPKLSPALTQLLAESGPKRIFATYTAMLALRKTLGKQHKLEDIES